MASNISLEEATEWRTKQLSEYETLDGDRTVKLRVERSDDEGNCSE